MFVQTNTLVWVGQRLSVWARARSAVHVRARVRVCVCDRCVRVWVKRRFGFLLIKPLCEYTEDRMAGRVGRAPRNNFENSSARRGGDTYNTPPLP